MEIIEKHRLKLRTGLDPAIGFLMRAPILGAGEKYL
jgi:hypothetical protein